MFFLSNLFNVSLLDKIENELPKYLKYIVLSVSKGSKLEYPIIFNTHFKVKNDVKRVHSVKPYNNLLIRE